MFRKMFSFQPYMAEDDGLTAGTGAEAPEVAEPVVEEGAEETEPAEPSKSDAAFAEMRRRAEEAERGHGAANGKNTHRAQPRAGQRAGEKTGQAEKCAGQHGGDGVAIHVVSPLFIPYNNRIWHAAAIGQNKNPEKILA